MSDAQQLGRSGALAVAQGLGLARRGATRMTLSIGIAALLLMATAAPTFASSVPPRDKAALIMGATTAPTLSDADVAVIMNRFIAPTPRDQAIEPVAVTTPEEFWPFTGLLRLIGLTFGPSELWGPGGSARPDEPWWKLSGLFDLTMNQSVQAGLADLESAMRKYGNDDLVIYGYSQGANIAVREKRKLEAQYPAGTTAPGIDFVLGGDPNLPNGGLLARFPGLNLSVLDWSFDGPEPTNTQFHTDVITRQYDLFADFPLYPLNVIADLNALLGGFYVHTDPFGVSLAPDPSTSPPINSQHDDTNYYFFPTEDLPLLNPLRTLGVPERVIDIVEPFFRVLVESGYDRSIPPWEPTPARLMPRHDPAKVRGDLVNARGEGIDNALALIGWTGTSGTRAPLQPSDTAPGTDTTTPRISAMPEREQTPRQTGDTKLMRSSSQTGRSTVESDRNQSRRMKLAQTIAFIDQVSANAFAHNRTRPFHQSTAVSPSAPDNNGPRQPAGMHRRNFGQHRR